MKSLLVTLVVFVQVVMGLRLDDPCVMQWCKAEIVACVQNEPCLTGLHCVHACSDVPCISKCVARYTAPLWNVTQCVKDHCM